MLKRYSIENKLKSRHLEELHGEVLDKDRIENLVVMVHPFYSKFVGGNVTREMIDCCIEKKVAELSCKKGRTGKDVGEGIRQFFEMIEGESPIDYMIKHIALLLLVGDLDNVKPVVEAMHLFGNLNEKTALVYEIQRDAESRYGEYYLGLINSLTAVPENTFHVIEPVRRNKDCCYGFRNGAYMHAMLELAEKKGKPVNLYFAGWNIKQCLVITQTVFMYDTSRLKHTLLYHAIGSSSYDIKGRMNLHSDVSTAMIAALRSKKLMDFARLVDQSYTSNFPELFREHVELIRKQYARYLRNSGVGKDRLKADGVLPGLSIEADYRHVDEIPELFKK